MIDPDVTDEMRRAGSKISSALISANVSYHIGGLGGSKTWEEWFAEGVPNKDLVIAYVENRIDSVTAIYIAMHRAKEQP